MSQVGEVAATARVQGTDQTIVGAVGVRIDAAQYVVVVLSASA